MNNKPVAYVDPIWMDRPDLVMSHQLEIGKLFARTQFNNYVPLYTHPVKELTKELDALLCSVLGEAYLGEAKEQELAKEIRAILRKAQKNETDY